jgi:hypothetical protein
MLGGWRGLSGVRGGRRHGQEGEAFRWEGLLGTLRPRPR